MSLHITNFMYIFVESRNADKIKNVSLFRIHFSSLDATVILLLKNRFILICMGGKHIIFLGKNFFIGLSISR